MTEGADIGVVGLGVMGANLALNMAEKGFRVAVYDRDHQRAAELAGGEFAAQFDACRSEAELLAAIRAPRAIVMMVPAGAATDTATAALASHAAPGDMLIDAGNSDFHETRRRTTELEARGLAFLGVGVSGGAEGARRGPAMMVGGTPEAWDRVAPVFKAIAAHYHGEPCADWLGPDGAGHFVKTVHNGIEYADMQMIAEIYGLMRDGLGLNDDRVAETFRQWASGPLSSYLVEITAQVAAARDRETGQPLLKVITDRAGQKGTGRWSVIEAHQLGAVVSTVEAAVGARNLSAATDLRGRVSAPEAPVTDVPALHLQDLHDALHAGKIIAYAQGIDLMTRASAEYSWGLDVGRVARLWRAGCIIRSAMLVDIAGVFDADPSSPLLSAPVFQDRLSQILPALRRVVAAAALDGLPVPALSNALAYLDQLSRPRGTANMLQGLRDFFGLHGFERTDRQGTGYHGPWADNR